MTEPTESRRAPVKALIREATGLNVYEKALLYSIESHSKGQMFVTADKAAAHMGGVAVRTFYNARKTLLLKNVIEVEERPRSTSVYRINIAALHLLLDPASPLARHAGQSAPPTSPGASAASPSMHQVLGEGEHEGKTCKGNTQTSPPPPEGVEAEDTMLDFDSLAAESRMTRSVHSRTAPSNDVSLPTLRSSEKVNQFAGYCARCQKRVEASQGLLGGRKPDGTVEVVHRENPCPGQYVPPKQPEPAPRTPAEEEALQDRLEAMKAKLRAKAGRA